MGIEGWKTVTGSLAVAAARLLVAFNVIPPSAGEAIEAVGTALATVGIGHKLDKAATQLRK